MKTRQCERPCKVMQVGVCSAKNLSLIRLPLRLCWDAPLDHPPKMETQQKIHTHTCIFFGGVLFLALDKGKWPNLAELLGHRK